MISPAPKAIYKCILLKKTFMWFSLEMGKPPGSWWLILKCYGGYSLIAIVLMNCLGAIGFTL
jgi:hypothetical protein